MYRKGYFRQRIDAARLAARVLDRHRSRAPARGARDRRGRRAADGHGADLRRRCARAQVWRVDVGRVPLYLLDTDRPENGAVDRWITARLYVGDERTRLAQYVAARRRRRARAARARASSPAWSTSTRATRRWRRSSSRGEGLRTGESLPSALAGGRARDGVHHPHAGAGGQRDLSGRRGARRRSAASLSELRHRRRGRDRAGPDEPRGLRPSRSASRSRRCG